MDCHFLLQGIFPTQGSYLGLLHCQQSLNHLSYRKCCGKGGVGWGGVVVVVVNDPHLILSLFCLKPSGALLACVPPQRSRTVPPAHWNQLAPPPCLTSCPSGWSRRMIVIPIPASLQHSSQPSASGNDLFLSISVCVESLDWVHLPHWVVSSLTARPWLVLHTTPHPAPSSGPAYKRRVGNIPWHHYYIYTYSDFLNTFGCAGSSLLCASFLQLWQVGGYSSSPCAGFLSWWLLLSKKTGSRFTGSVVEVLGLSCFVTCGIFPAQGSNSCLLRWRADSYPLDHQQSPKHIVLVHRIMTSTTICWKISLGVLGPGFCCTSLLKF